ncbi:MAG: DUF503 domain-containing protein [Candidatus Handelsmanbacteria bacterium]|nr:DUF503 domain-containing protein [Candidatus Handelsmanbacteria bacterium]
MCCEVQLYLSQSRSLKDKRQVVKSLKDRLRSRFNVAVAEVEHQDLWQRGTLGLAVISTEADHAREMLDEAVRFVEQDLRVQVLASQIEER